MTSISTSGFYDSAIFSMASLQAQASKLQGQISSGNRLTTSADDPVSAAQLRSLSAADALDSADSANSAAAKTNLTQTDNTLSSFADVVTRLQELATQAASGTLNDSQRAGIGTEVAALRTNLVALANTQDAAGHALFGGESGGAAYALDGAGNASYVGGATAGTLSLGTGLSVTRGITGPEFLKFTAGGQPTDLLGVVKALGDALQNRSGAQAAAHGALDQLNGAMDAITTAQTVVGARLAWIDTTSAIRTQLSQQRNETESSVGGTDLASTVARLQQITTVLQASQSSFVKVAALSLFDMIH